MWVRKAVKDKAKMAFKANYWKCVLSGLVISLVTGSSVSGAVKNLGKNADLHVEGYVGHGAESIFSFFPVMFMFFGIAMIIGVLFIALFSLCIKIFLYNPLELCCKSFFNANLYNPRAGMSEFGRGFSGNYLNGVKILFLRDLYTLLWTLLFIVPGIIKRYEYRMVPYLLAENPNISTQEAFERSRDLMMHNKWKAFVLDLSFIGWHILSAFTFGLLDIFYVVPYQESANAALYDALRLGYGREQGPA